MSREKLLLQVYEVQLLSGSLINTAAAHIDLLPGQAAEVVEEYRPSLLSHIHTYIHTVYHTHGKQILELGLNDVKYKSISHC